MWGEARAGGVGHFSEAEVLRVARLCRLRLSDEERARLPQELDAITTAFGDLVDHAAGLPEPTPEPAAEPRPDVVMPAPANEVEAILRTAPRVDAASRSVVAPRGGA